MDFVYLTLPCLDDMPASCVWRVNSCLLVYLVLFAHCMRNDIVYLEVIFVYSQVTNKRIDTFISFAGPFRLSEALLLGITRTFLLVRSDLTHFQLEDPYQTYMVGRWYNNNDVILLFGSKVTESKNILLLLFLASWRFQILCMWLVLTMTEKSMGTEFWISSP